MVEAKSTPTGHNDFPNVVDPYRFDGLQWSQ